MGKSAPKAPAAPDPVALANAQSASNAETARLQGRMNRVDEYTPYGSSVYTDLGNDRFRLDTTLNPEQQAALTAEQKLDTGTNQLALGQIGRVQESVAKPFSYEGLPQAPGVNDFGAERQRVEDSLYNRSLSRLNPEFDQDQRRLEVKLANQGINQGSEAYTREQDAFNRAKTDALDTARSSAVAAGGSEQSRLFGLGSTARQQAIQEYATKRNQPINEVAALLGTGQISNPNFTNVPQVNVGNTDVIGANALATNVALNNYNQRLNSRNSTLGSVAGLAGALGGAYLGGPSGAAAGSRIGQLF